MNAPQQPRAPIWALLLAMVVGSAAVGAAMSAAGCAAEGSKNKRPVTKADSDPNALSFDENLDLPQHRASAEGSNAKAPDVAQASGARGNWALPGSPGGPAGSAADRGASTARTKAQAQQAPTATAAAATDDPGGRWGVLLLSFTDEEHEASAEAACRALQQHYPLLKDAYVRAKSNGSVVLAGRFDGLDDPGAKPFVKQVQSLQDGNERPFARSFLTRVQPARRGASAALELSRVREENPGVRDLYSLEVAVWSDFGSRELSLDEIRRRAEDYAKSLRARGFMAYYQHDDDKRMSMVTVGVFGKDAYDPKAMVYSDEVEAIRRAFPKLMVNGEDLMRPVMRGSKETVPERPVLILVPN